MPSQTSVFRNVDLLLTSACDLAPVAKGLGRGVLVLHHGQLGRTDWLLLELAVEPRTPTRAIQAFAKLATTLRGRARTLWTHAGKEFDIGVEVGAQREPAEWVIDADAVALAARLGARLRFTVYARPARAAARRPRFRGRAQPENKAS